MGVPAADMAEAYARTIQEIREKLEQRVSNASNRLEATPTLHRGRVSPENLPEGPLHVWVDWDEVHHEDETFQAVSLVSSWLIQVVAPDEGGDQFGTESQLGERVWGGILKTLTQTADDLGLSGTLDFLTTRSRHVRGTPGANRRVDYYEIAVEAHHQMELVRDPNVLSIET